MIPTTEKNIGERLFFRYFLIYIAAFVPLLLAVRRGLPLPCPAEAGRFSSVLFSLFLFGGVPEMSGGDSPLVFVIKAGGRAACR